MGTDCAEALAKELLDPKEVAKRDDAFAEKTLLPDPDPDLKRLYRKHAVDQSAPPFVWHMFQWGLKRSTVFVEALVARASFPSENSSSAMMDRLDELYLVDEEISPDADLFFFRKMIRYVLDQDW